MKLDVQRRLKRLENLVPESAATASFQRSTAQLDATSLVWSRQDGPESYTSHYSATASQNYHFEHPTFGDMTWINQGGNAVGAGISAQGFTVPAGCTEAIASFTYIEDGVHAPAVFQWSIVDNTGAVIVASGNLTPTAALQSTQLVASGLIAGAQYLLLVTVNATAQQSTFLIGGKKGGAKPIAVAPVGASGIFATPFFRKRIDANDYVRNCQPTNWFVPTGSFASILGASNFSYVEFVTNAEAISADLWGDNPFNTGGFRVDVDGAFSQYVQPAAPSLGAQVLSFALPPGEKLVRLTIGAQSNSTGTWIRALYFPGYAFVASPQPDPQQNSQTVMFVGDSITVAPHGDNGITQSVGDRNAAMLLADAGVCEPTYLASAGWSLAANLVNSTQSAATVVSKIPSSVRVVYINIGVNDWLSNVCTPAQFQIFYGYLLASLNTLRPDIRVFAQNLLPEVNEGANAGGFTMANYNAAIAAVVPSYSATFVDAHGTFGIVAATDNNPDGVHPNDIGYAKWAAGINVWLRSNFLAPGVSVQPAWELLQQQVQSLQANQFVDASVQARFRADQSVTLVVGKCSAWNDMRIGGTPSATQANAARRPTFFATGGPNNRPYLKFVRANVDFLQTGAIAGLTQPCMILVVARFNVLGTGTLVDGILTNSGRIFSPSAGNLEIFAGAGLVLAGGIKAGDWHAIAAFFNGAASNVNLDYTAGTTGAAGANNPLGLTIGDIGAGGDEVDADIAEVLALSGTPTAQYLNNVNAYLQSYYNLPILVAA